MNDMTGAPAGAPRLTAAHFSLAAIGLMWTLPFLQPFHRFPLTSFYSEWLAFGLGLVASLLLAARQSWREAELPVVALAPPALVVLLGVQVALGRVPYPEQVIPATWYLLWASLLMLLARVLVRSLGMTTLAATLAWCLLAGGILSALAGLAQHYQVFPSLDFLVTRKGSFRVSGNLGQPNHYAAYITMALCSAAYLCASDRLRTAWAAACAALLLPVLALSGSRSPWLYFTVLAVLALLLFRARREAGGRKLMIFTLCLIPGFIVAQWVASTMLTGADPGGQVTSAQRLFETAVGVDPRIQLAREAWEMFLSSPALGAGFGQYSWHHFTYMAAISGAADPRLFHHAHNIVLHLMAETGAVGALLVTGAALLWLADLRGVRPDLEWWWALALLGIIGVHSMMEFPLWHSYFLGIAAVLLGFGARRVARLRLAGLARVAVALLMLAGWFNLVSALPYYRQFERLVFLPESRGSTPADERAFADAITRLHREPLLAPYVGLAMAYGVTVTEDRLQDKLELVARAVHFAPVPVVSYRYALLLALAGSREAALAQLERSLRVYPREGTVVILQLEELARAHPDKFNPLLELAAARIASPRAPAGHP